MLLLNITILILLCILAPIMVASLLPTIAKACNKCQIKTDKLTKWLN